MKVVWQGAGMGDLRALGYSILLKKWFFKRVKLVEDTSNKVQTRMLDFLHQTVCSLIISGYFFREE